jgi:hypothetical protein
MQSTQLAEAPAGAAGLELSDKHVAEIEGGAR